MIFLSTSQIFLVVSVSEWSKSWPVLLLAGICGYVVGHVAVRAADFYVPCFCGVKERLVCRIAREIIIRLIGVAVFVGVAVRFGVSFAAIPTFLAAAVLMVLSTIDLRSYRLPDAIVLPALGVSFATVFLVSIIIDNTAATLTAVATAFGYGFLCLRFM